MSNQLSWADVAHYYQGIEIEATQGIAIEANGQRLHSAIINVGGTCIAIPFAKQIRGMPLKRILEPFEYRPILYALDSMTAVQADDLFAQCHLASFANHSMAISNKNSLEYYQRKYFRMQHWYLRCRPLEFVWLIKNGFDIFGLIESGQAIRKDKVQNEA